MANKTKVIVVGGGIGGMSAAHELAERGFEVEVYERHHTYYGGKARSVDVPDTNLIDKNKYLPGEHGFRFFPGFYKHVTDTMKRIPYTGADGKPNKDGCFDNLTPTSRIMLAIYGKEPIVMPASFPRNLADVELILHDVFGGLDTGLSNEEKKFFAGRVWQCMTSSLDRRYNEYERISWWDFMQADRFGDAYRHLLVEGLTRSLVAARAEVASMKTGSSVTLQLMYCMLDAGVNTDRVLNGPTNEKWLYPWHDYLKSIGVKYFLGHKCCKVNYAKGKVTSVEVHDPEGNLKVITGDIYILAAPVERAAMLISDEMVKHDPSLSGLHELAKSTSWMNGIQFYLNEDVAISNGHVCYSYSE